MIYRERNRYKTKKQMNVIITMDSLKLVLLINKRMISIYIYDSKQSSKYHLTECLVLKYQFPPTNY